MSVGIIGSGQINDLEKLKKSLIECEYIICSDGGARHLNKINIKPNLLVGDFDSIDKFDFDAMKSDGVEVVEFPPEKDFTDSHLAIDIGIEKGYKELRLYGVTGSRLDHSLCNIFLLEYIKEKGCNGTIFDDNNVITLIEGIQEYTFNKTDIGNLKYFSMLAIDEKVEGITLKGFKYNIEDYTLNRGVSRGVSNEARGYENTDEMSISVNKGKLLIVFSKD